MSRYFFQKNFLRSFSYYALAGRACAKFWEGQGRWVNMGQKVKGYGQTWGHGPHTPTTRKRGVAKKWVRKQGVIPNFPVSLNLHMIHRIINALNCR